jgi:hypothetical protein
MGHLLGHFKCKFQRNRELRLWHEYCIYICITKMYTVMNKKEFSYFKILIAIVYIAITAMILVAIFI